MAQIIMPSKEPAYRLHDIQRCLAVQYILAINMQVFEPTNISLGQIANHLQVEYVKV